MASTTMFGIFVTDASGAGKFVESVYTRRKEVWTANNRELAEQTIGTMTASGTLRAGETAEVVCLG